MIVSIQGLKASLQFLTMMLPAPCFTIRMGYGVVMQYLFFFQNNIVNFLQNISQEAVRNIQVFWGNIKHAIMFFLDSSGFLYGVFPTLFSNIGHMKSIMWGFCWYFLDGFFSVLSYCPYFWYDLWCDPIRSYISFTCCLIVEWLKKNRSLKMLSETFQQGYMKVAGIKERLTIINCSWEQQICQ